MTDWSFDAWAPVDPANWRGARYDHPSEQDCHVDIGCGTIKKGRIGVDLRPAPGVNVLMDLDTGRVFGVAPAPNRDAAEVYGSGWRYHTLGETAYYPVMPLPQNAWGETGGEPYTIGRGLPFDDNSIESIVSHHCLEHVGAGFLPLMDDIYRVLKPGATLRVIVPLFPSSSATSDQDHCRYFMEESFMAFCGHLGDENNPTGSWLDSFSVPYTKCRYQCTDTSITKRVGPEKHWTNEDVRELRVTLVAVK